MYSRYLGLSLIIKTVKPMRPAGIIIQLLLIILSAIVFGVGGFMSGFPYFFYINLYQQRNNSLRASNHDKTDTNSSELNASVVSKDKKRK